MIAVIGVVLAIVVLVGLLAEQERRWRRCEQRSPALFAPRWPRRETCKDCSTLLLLATSETNSLSATHHGRAAVCAQEGLRSQSGQPNSHARQSENSGRTGGCTNLPLDSHRRLSSQRQEPS